MSILPISLCIPSFQRFSFLKEKLQSYIDNPYIHEIIINDEDGSDITKIEEHFPNQPKLKLYKNEQVLGPFRNKNKVVSYAKNNWVCLMDSDNFAPIEYFKKWIEFVQQNGLDAKNIYFPSRTIPQDNHPGFDFTQFQNIIWTKNNCDLKYVNDIKWLTMMNIGNYIFHKQNYLESNQFYIELHDNCDIQDVLLKNILLLKNNSKLFIVPNMEYHHIVHPQSFFINNEHHFDSIHILLKQKLLTINDS